MKVLRALLLPMILSLVLGLWAQPAGAEDRSCRGQGCGEACSPDSGVGFGPSVCDSGGSCKPLWSVQCALTDPCAGAGCGDPCCPDAETSPCIATGRCTAAGECISGFVVCSNPDETCVRKNCGQQCGGSPLLRCDASGQCVKDALLLCEPPPIKLIPCGLEAAPGELCVPDECLTKSCGDSCNRRCREGEENCDGFAQGKCDWQSSCSTAGVDPWCPSLPID